MKIVCQKAVLSKAVGLAQNAVSGKSTLPILGNLLFETTKEGIDILGTDLEIGLKCKAEVEVVKQGSITIPAKKLSDLIRASADQEIELSVEGGTKVNFKCGKFNSSIMGLSKEDFPNLPEVKNEKVVEIKDNDLMEMIKKVVFSVSNDETRRILNGALLSVDGKEVKMVSTDGHRLSFIRKEIDGGKEKHSVILPTKALNEILKILDGGEEKVQLSFSEGHLFVHKGSTVLVTRLIEGQFPNYDQVIPKKHETSFVADTDALHKATYRVSLLASDRSSSVRYSLKKDSLVISSTTPDVGEAEEELEVGYSGPEMTIAYNPKFLIDAFKALDAPKLEMLLSSPLNPGVIVGHEGRRDYQCVVMPMRV